MRYPISCHHLKQYFVPSLKVQSLKSRVAWLYPYLEEY
jgi:hypothetical protein